MGGFFDRRGGGGVSSLQSQGVRYMFLEWEHSFIFCAPSKLIILPQLVVLRPRFFPDRCTTVFFSCFCAQYFHPGCSLLSHFYRGVFLALSRSNSTVSPASRARGALRQSFFPKCRAAFFFRGASRSFFFQELHGRFFVKVRAPDTTQFTPLPSSLRFVH